VQPKVAWLLLFFLTCDRASIASADEMSGARFDVVYTGDIWRNLDGGKQQGNAYLDNLDLKLEFGVGTGTAFAYLVYNNADRLSEPLTGDLQGLSNIDSAHVIRLFELWYEQPVGSDQSLKFGLYDLNSEFDSVDTASLFLNSSHGIGAEYAQTGENGPSIFPTTSLALRYFAQNTEQIGVRAAILDGVPGDINNFQKNVATLRKDEGALLATEVDFSLAPNPDRLTSRGEMSSDRIGIGGWYYTEPTSLLIAVPAPDRGTKNNRGIYGFYERQTELTDGRSIAGWVRLGFAESSINQIDSYTGGGVAISGLLPSAYEDSLGLAIAVARNSGDYRAVTGPETLDREINLELTWRIRVSPRLVIQPDLQFVHHPGTDSTIEDAVAIGVRFVLDLQ